MDLYDNPCLEKACKVHNVRNLYVFGSFASGSETDQSDIDFIVDFYREGFDGAFEQFMGFKEALESIFERPVDLIVSRKFRNEIFDREVEKTKQLLYAA